MNETAGARQARVPEQSWWIELARVVGEKVGRASATLTPRRPVSSRRSTEALLGELGQIMSEHADQGYASLEGEPRFWALVRHLHLRHRHTRSTRRRRPRSADAVVDAAEAAADSSGNDTGAIDEAAPVAAIIEAAENGEEPAAPAEAVAPEAGEAEERATDVAASAADEAEESAVEPAPTDGADESAASAEGDPSSSHTDSDVQEESS